MNNALVCHAVNDRHRLLIGCGGIFVVPFFDGGYYTLNVGANHGTETGVMTAGDFVLTRALAGLCRVGQLMLLGYFQCRFGVDDARYRPSITVATVNVYKQRMQNSRRSTMPIFSNFVKGCIGNRASGKIRSLPTGILTCEQGVHDEQDRYRNQSGGS